MPYGSPGPADPRRGFILSLPAARLPGIHRPQLSSDAVRW